MSGAFSRIRRAPGAAAPADGRRAERCKPSGGFHPCGGRDTEPPNELWGTECHAVLQARKRLVLVLWSHRSLHRRSGRLAHGEEGRPLGGPGADPSGGEEALPGLRPEDRPGARFAARLGPQYTADQFLGELRSLRIRARSAGNRDKRLLDRTSRLPGPSRIVCPVT